MTLTDSMKVETISKEVNNFINKDSALEQMLKPKNF